MKLFGYLDDLVTMWYNWQSALPLEFKIPLTIAEIIIAAIIILKLRQAIGYV
jgi:hypothetical protein